MKIFHKAKDGGPDSNVTGYWLIEWKGLFSIVLLRFSKGSREAFHNHAFHALSWIISGELVETYYENDLYVRTQRLKPSLLPFITKRSRLHKVYGVAESTWALSFRGPWSKTWQEYFDKTNTTVTLTNGRKIVG